MLAMGVTVLATGDEPQQVSPVCLYSVLSRSWWRIGSGVISGLKINKPIRRLAAAVGDNANVDRYIKRPDW
jgi:hypothetical protein